ncbi:3-keto-disaccharide hydrolase [Chitinophaga niabensis]|uniref:3-keto-alpha-glucoside-1,2-lyase/3-keto-2-hydroxy-glucal hydratase domain-containing protein n=1 Tax=Chitinophaga niabensis TaxID=536979 RepID=A0A1N6DQ70_9BACT|nr:DUF1080 domain-containing protein [Chitinophaga niabensis]SIN72949.1 protein of unknown function [Chitinophaga niabensis]
MYSLKSLIVCSAVMLPLFASAQQGDPKATEVWEPVPVKVTPGTGTAAPSDAIVLFDGKNLNSWESDKGGPAPFVVKDGAMTVTPKKGGIKTKEAFEDFQLHIEWRSPSVIKGEGQGRGNSGIFLQSYYELQVLDSYESKTYSNGQAGSIYKQSIPLVNACKKPGEWQTYDVIWTAPRFNDDGSVKSPARITVLHNNILVQNNTELKGKTEYIGQPTYVKHGAMPLALQDHGDLVSYRNIWIRKL